MIGYETSHDFEEWYFFLFYDEIWIFTTDLQKGLTRTEF